MLPAKPKASETPPQPPSPVLSQTPDSGQPLHVPPSTPISLNKHPALKKRGPITLNKRHPVPLAKPPALKQRNHTTTRQPVKKNLQWESKPEAEQEQEPELDLPPFVSHATSAPIWIPGCKPELWRNPSPPCAYEQYPEGRVHHRLNNATDYCAHGWEYAQKERVKRFEVNGMGKTLEWIWGPSKNEGDIAEVAKVNKEE